MSCCFPFGEGVFFVARRVKAGSVPRLGVVDLRGCRGESCHVYSCSTQVLPPPLFLSMVLYSVFYYGTILYFMFHLT